MDMTLLGNLLAYSAQVGLVVAIGAGLAALVRVDAAGVRYVYWRGLLALCLVLPWLQVPRFVVVQMKAMPPAVANVSLPAIPEAIPAGAVSDPSIDWVSFVVWILLAGVCFRTCRVGVGLWRLRRLRAAGCLAPPSAVHDEMQGLVRARAEIRYVPSGQPVTFGFRRPVVLLPEMLRSQPEEIQRVVLCHELFHVRRRDWVWAVAEEMVKAALWFHPAVWWLVSRVRLAREEVVDELTVLATSERRAYMEALLVFADAPTEAPAAAFARRRHLFRRMLLISKEAVMSSKRILLSVAAMTVVVVVGVCAAMSVFPMTQTVMAQGRAGGPVPAAGAQPQAGTIERQAKPITPENPIPRRTFSIAPQIPSVETNGVVMVSVRIVVDRQGRVAEARNTGIGARGGRAGVVTPSTDAFAKAVIDAVRQWQYDPPADGPIAFDVAFVFAPGAEPRLLSHGGAPVVVAGRSPMIPPPPPPPPVPPQPPRAPQAGAAPQPPRTPLLAPDWPAPVRVGGGIEAPRKLTHVDPIYPPIAQSARVQGVVILEVLIAPDGKVAETHVLRSIPLLDQAATDSVRQWVFEPTHLNGAPVPVMMTVTVNFSLP
jgi:TonB family protein